MHRDLKIKTSFNIGVPSLFNLSGFLIGVLVVTLGLIHFLYQWSVQNTPFNIVLLLGFISLIILIYYKKTRTGEIIIVFFITGLMSFAGIVDGSDFSLNMGPILICLIIASMYFISKHVIESKQTHLISIWGMIPISTYVVYLFAVEGYFLASYDNVFASSSRNILGGYIISAASVMTASFYKEKNRILIWPILLSFLITLIVGNRSNVLIAFLFLTIITYVRYKGLKMFLILAAIIFLFFNIASEYLIIMFEMTKFQEQGFDTPRWELWMSYFKAVPLRSFLVGYPVDNIPLINHFNNNPHSSFISLYSHFGFFPYLVLTMIIFKNIYKISFIPLISFFFVLLRMSTDFFSFSGPIGFYFMLLLLLLIKK